MLKKKGILIPFLFIFITNFSFSLDPNTKIYKYINRVLTTREGLPQNTVYDIAQDGDGYIWIGTDDGVCRYDGFNVMIFNKTNTTEIKNNKILTLFLSSSGDLWMGTFGGGITVYKNKKFTNYNTSQGLPNDFIWTITEDIKNNIWIGTIGGGMVSYKNNRFKIFNTQTGLPSNNVKALCADESGNLWIGTENGLVCLNTNDPPQTAAIPITNSGEGIINNHIMSIFKDSKNRLWIGTISGLSVFSHGKFNNYTTTDGLSNNTIRAIFEDRKGNIWISTDFGLNRFKNNKIETYLGLSDNSLMQIFEDREENLWIGTTAKGLNILHDSKFTVYTIRDGLTKNSIRPVYEDQNKNLWIGTDGGGINLLTKVKTSISDKIQIQSFSRKDGLNSNFINTIYGDRQGQIWIGTSKGLQYFNNATFSDLKNINELSAFSITALHEDRKGNLWIGTFGEGIKLYKKGDFFDFNHNHGLSDNIVYSIAESREGDLWIGTNKGLNRLKNNNVKIYSTKDGLSNDTIYDIYIDSDNVLWIGTNGGGLIRFHQDEFFTFTTDIGLFSDVVYRIIEDNKKNFWMTSNRGIFCIPREKLNQYSRKEIRAINCLYFQEDDGLKSSVCSGGFQPAGWKSEAGNLIFPTKKGVAIIHPEKIVFNKIPPPLVITRIAADGILVDQKKDRTFPANTKKIEIHYTALSFTAPEKIKFSYRLMGYNKKWINTKGREKIEFSKLTPGIYKFKIIACNNDGIWNYKGATYTFKIKAVFYKTFWFFLIMIPALFLFIIIFLKVKKNRIIKMSEETRKYRKSTLTAEKSRIHLQKLLKIMKEEKPYLDPEINIEKLAGMIPISKKHLSQVINEHKGQNFKNFINFYRVEEAKIKILDPKEKDFVLLKIAFDVGFNSKSVFNSVFKKMTGMSPSEFRKKYSDIE